MSLPARAESSAAVPATFIARRLFSLSGVLPLGAFVVLHLIWSVRVLSGQAAFDATLAHLTPLRLGLEALLIGVPLIFHAALGLTLIRRSRINVGRYPFGGNWSYALQRVTGPVALVFIAYHVWELRVRVLLGRTSSYDFRDSLCATLSSTGLGGVPWAALGYLVGVAAVTFHLAAGCVGFAESFGLVRTSRDARRLGVACAIAGVLLFALGVSTVIGLATGAAPLFGS